MLLRIYCQKKVRCSPEVVLNKLNSGMVVLGMYYIATYDALCCDCFYQSANLMFIKNLPAYFQLFKKADNMKTERAERKLCT